MTPVARVALVVLLALLAGPVGLGAGAAGAAPKRTYRAVIEFQKNTADQFDSRVVWRLLEKQGGTERVVQERSWRAGAGLPRKGGKNACRRDVGWAPNGDYRVTFHRDYAGNVVKGGVFRMDDMRCADGTRRQQLFLHTEQGPGSRQCPNRRGDQACRWEAPRINDWKSNGCLKMAPADLRELTRLFDRRFDAGVRYPLRTVTLRVSG